jgi:hypothetical protein
MILFYTIRPVLGHSLSRLGRSGAGRKRNEEGVEFRQIDVDSVATRGPLGCEQTLFSFSVDRPSGAARAPGGIGAADQRYSFAVFSMFHLTYCRVSPRSGENLVREISGFLRKVPPRVLSQKISLFFREYLSWEQSRV